MSSPPKPSQDDALLSRLRALRPNTTVNFTPSTLSSPPSQSTPSQTFPDQPSETPDALLSRFQSLYGPQTTRLPDDEPPEEDFEDENEEEQSLDDLLAALQEDQSWGFYAGKGDGAEEIQEAKGAIRDVLRGFEEMRREGRGVEEIHDDVQESEEVRKEGYDVGDGENGKEKMIENQDEGEDKEADEAMQKIIAELSLEGDDDEDTVPDSKADHEQNQTDPTELEDDADFELPSAPSTLPSIPTDTFDLPSTPSAAPQSRAKPTPTSATKKFTDEEIDSWCIICHADGTVTCLDCDDDIYCERCWIEGHKGEGAGREERGHRARRIVKGGDAGGDGGGKKERRRVYAS